MKFTDIVSRAIGEAISSMRSEHGVTITAGDIRGMSRRRAICVGRKMAVMSMHDSGLMTYEDIGVELGGRDHSTIHYLVHGKVSHAR